MAEHSLAGEEATEGETKVTIIEEGRINTTRIYIKTVHITVVASRRRPPEAITALTVDRATIKIAGEW